MPSPHPRPRPSEAAGATFRGTEAHVSTATGRKPRAIAEDSASEGPRGAGAPEGVAGGLIGWGPALTPCRALLAAHVAVALALAVARAAVVWCGRGQGVRRGGRGVGVASVRVGGVAVWAWPPLLCTWLLQLPSCWQSPPYPWEPRCSLADTCNQRTPLLTAPPPPAAWGAPWDPRRPRQEGGARCWLWV